MSIPGIDIQVGTLMWSFQVTGLTVVFGSLCSQGQFQLGFDFSLPICAWWSELLLFSPGSSCIAL
jgi:hypothetical protein